MLDLGEDGAGLLVHAGTSHRFGARTAGHPGDKYLAAHD
jgi:hypothetical protein